jgi:hypothetical protein
MFTTKMGGKRIPVVPRSSGKNQGSALVTMGPYGTLAPTEAAGCSSL